LVFGRATNATVAAAMMFPTQCVSELGASNSLPALDFTVCSGSVSNCVRNANLAKMMDQMPSAAPIGPVSAEVGPLANRQFAVFIWPLKRR
jgi:hypothetical protein